MVLTESKDMTLGTPASLFSLPDTRDSNSISLQSFAGQPVLIAFICNHCPYVVHLLKAFTHTANNLSAQGVATVAISANDAQQYPADSPQKMAELAESYGFEFPYCHDESQAVARSYGAVCTPDFFLFDATHRLYYHGRFDDSRPGQAAATGADLEDAAEQLLAHKAAPQTTFPSIGCSIKWKP